MRNALILLFLIQGNLGYSQEIDLKNYSKIGTIDSLSLRRSDGPNSNGPTDFLIFKKQILTWDRYDDSWVTFDMNLKEKTRRKLLSDDLIISYEVPIELFSNDDGGSIIFEGLPNQFVVVDSLTLKNKSKPIFTGLTSGLRNKYLMFTHFDSDLLIIEERDTSIYHSFRLPNDPDKEAEYLDPGKTKKAILALGGGSSGLHFDEKGFLWNGEKLLTRSAFTFSRHTFKDNSPRNRPELPLAASFLGVDKQGNYYWGGSKYFFIFSKDFIFQKKFMISFEYDESKVGPISFLDEDGNIYGFTLDISRKIVDVYFLKRDW